MVTVSQMCAEMVDCQPYERCRDPIPVTATDRKFFRKFNQYRCLKLFMGDNGHDHVATHICACELRCREGSQVKQTEVTTRFPNMPTD
jgi:hypothetical protein